MKIHNVEQKSVEWFDLKKQFPFSASKAQAIANAEKGLETIVDEAIISQYSIAEKERFTNEHLERGNELEPQARTMYELETGYTVSEVGFVTDDMFPFAGVSPDGFVKITSQAELAHISDSDDGLLEIKCLADNVFIKKLYTYSVTKNFRPDPAHDWQMQMQMLFTGRMWCDYAIYNPNFKKSLLITRVYADPIKQEKIKVGLRVAEKMLLERKELMDKLN